MLLLPNGVKESLLFVEVYRGISAEGKPPTGLDGMRPHSHRWKKDQEVWSPCDNSVSEDPVW